MEKRETINNCGNVKGRMNRGCIEANTLAIIDSAEIHKDSQDAKDDRSYTLRFEFNSSD